MEVSQLNSYGEGAVSCSVAGATFGDIGVFFSVAGTIFGDVGALFFVAGAALVKVWEIAGA